MTEEQKSTWVHRDRTVLPGEAKFYEDTFTLDMGPFLLFKVLYTDPAGNYIDSKVILINKLIEVQESPIEMVR